jgi:hypothetical protein
MADGKSLGLLQPIGEIAKQASPQIKQEPNGFLGSLKLAHSPGVIKNDSYDGHTKTVKVTHKQRFTVAQTSTTESCDVVNTQPTLENTVSVANYVQFPLFVEDTLISQMDSFASALVSPAGSKPVITDMMFEFYDSLISATSAINQAVNQSLLTLAVAAVGVNRVTGVNTAQTINIPQASATNILGNNVNKIKTDWLANNFTGKMIGIGAGNFLAWLMQQPAKGLDGAGVDTRVQAAGFDFFVDYDLSTALSTQPNDVIFYEKDSVQLVEFMKFRGNFAGDKGTVRQGIIMLPMNAGNGLTIPMMYDYQLFYQKCATTYAYVNGEENVTLQRGWHLIVSKNYGLYVLPSNGYRAGDPLSGNRGSLIYRVTNT